MKLQWLFLSYRIVVNIKRVHKFMLSGALLGLEYALNKLHDDLNLYWNTETRLQKTSLLKGKRVI